MGKEKGVERPVFRLYPHNAFQNGECRFMRAKRRHRIVGFLTFALLLVVGYPETGYSAESRPTAPCPWDATKDCTYYRVTEERPNTALANRASRDVPRALSEIAVEELSRYE